MLKAGARLYARTVSTMLAAEEAVRRSTRDLPVDGLGRIPNMPEEARIQQNTSRRPLVLLN
jgi:hypothetical protein